MSTMDDFVHHCIDVISRVTFHPTMDFLLTCVARMIRGKSGCDFPDRRFNT